MSTPGGIGPYRVVDVLGRGGMGVVYRGEHEATGAEAAVKVVSVASGASIAAIRREIHALACVRHPGVLRILDQGLADGLPWYAMDLVRGSTLRVRMDEHRRGAIARAPTEPLVSRSATTVIAPVPGPHGETAQPASDFTPRPLDADLLEICAGLCEPLTVVHAAGLVHRDLKPENILIRPDGRPVLVDFGIAAGFGGASGREVLAAAGPVIGTVEYMAPEQIRGELVDARADLYSLGCILYECLTGHTPFAARDAGEVLRGHLEDPPIAPSQRGAAVPADLDALVLRLLAKRAADRIGYAADVAAALRELGFGAGADAGPAARGEAYLYRAELTGRDDVMARAAAVLGALARERRGGAIHVSGESGVGKTRLALEIAREAERLGVKVLAGQCAPGELGGSTPLHPFSPLVRAALPAVASSAAGRVLAPYFPEIAALPGFDRSPDPPPLAPDAARARALDALESVILDLAEAEPILWMLDDVQWADGLSLALLGRLDAAKLAARGLLGVYLYRAEEAGDALLSAAAAPGVERWDLARLDGASVAAMAAGMLATRRLPPAWAELVARVSDGNPFFAGEYLRAAVDAGILERDPRGRWSIQAADAAKGEALAVPTTVDALLDARFGRLGDAERRFLGAAAVLGRAFEGDVAAATAGLDERAALDAVSALERRQILEDAAGGRLRFVHDRLRETACAHLGAEDRQELHRSAAAAIEARHRGDPAEYGPLAGHHAAAGERVAAYWYYTLAASRAEAVYANEQAIALHRAALGEAEAGGAAPVRRAETASRLGHLLQRAGRAEEAREAYARALANVAPASVVERARLHLAVGKTWDTRQRHAEALAACAEAERALGAAPPASEDEASWWEVLVQIGIERIQVHYWAADNEALARVVAELGPVVERRGTDSQRAYFFLTLVQRDLRGARYRTSPETVEYARRSLTAFVRSVDRDQTANARFTLAAVLLWNDALDEAEVELLAALEEAEAIGTVWIQVASLAYLTVIGRRRRDVDTTRALSFRCLAASEEAKLPQYAGVAEANLGWVHLENGSGVEAERLCRSALARWRDLPLVYPFQWLARLPLAKLALEAGELGEAAAQVRAMGEPSQQRLPEALEAALSEGRVEEALRAAEALGFV